MDVRLPHHDTILNIVVITISVTLKIELSGPLDLVHALLPAVGGSLLRRGGLEHDAKPTLEVADRIRNHSSTSKVCPKRMESFRDQRVAAALCVEAEK